MEEEEIIKHEQDIDTLSVHELEALIADYQNKIKDLEKKIEHLEKVNFDLRFKNIKLQDPKK